MCDVLVSREWRFGCSDETNAQRKFQFNIHKQIKSEVLNIIFRSTANNALASVLKQKKIQTYRRRHRVNATWILNMYSQFSLWLFARRFTLHAVHGSDRQRRHRWGRRLCVSKCNRSNLLQCDIEMATFYTRFPYEFLRFNWTNINGYVRTWLHVMAGSMRMCLTLQRFYDSPMHWYLILFCLISVYVRILSKNRVTIALSDLFNSQAVNIIRIDNVNAKSVLLNSETIDWTRARKPLM